jgi:hypothetical protein
MAACVGAAVQFGLGSLIWSTLVRGSVVHTLGFLGEVRTALLLIAGLITPGSRPHAVSFRPRPARLPMALRPIRKLLQVLELPDWAGSDMFDIEARPAGNATIDQMYGPMLQVLLEGRFQLKIHRELSHPAPARPMRHRTDDGIVRGHHAFRPTRARPSGDRRDEPGLRCSSRFRSSRSFVGSHFDQACSSASRVPPDATPSTIAKPPGLMAVAMPPREHRSLLQGCRPVPSLWPHPDPKDRCR